MLKLKFYIVLTLCMFISNTLLLIVNLILQVLINIQNVYIHLGTMALVVDAASNRNE